MDDSSADSSLLSSLTLSLSLAFLFSASAHLACAVTASLALSLSIAAKGYVFQCDTHRLSLSSSSPSLSPRCVCCYALLSLHKYISLSPSLLLISAKFETAEKGHLLVLFVCFDSRSFF